MTECEMTGKLRRGERDFVAWKAVKPAAIRSPTGIIFLGGFNSDMSGTKASAMAAWAAAAGYRFLRFDYFGHGESSGEFARGTIGGWLEDTLAVVDELTEDGQILVGSSMGGWLALLAALARPKRIKGLLLVAPATDFTEELMWAGFSEDIRQQILTEGHYLEPSPYGDPYTISHSLIEEGRRHLLFGRSIPLNIPVRILQGMRDEEVPHPHAMKLLEALQGEDVALTLVKDGDHRFSKPNNIEMLLRGLQALLTHVGG
jgi:pimeloyl-ACP methyl ester carboxylesterase